MNFNPFARHISIRKLLFKSNHLNMFERVVGIPQSMGVLDYALVLPFLIKLGIHLSDNKSTLGTVVFSALSIPFAIAKFFLYIGLSPLVFAAWSTKQIIQKISKSLHVSPFCDALNHILAKRFKDRNDATIKPVPLGKISKFHDGKLKKYIIKGSAYGELVLARANNEQIVAVFDTSRANLIAINNLYKLTDSHQLEYHVKTDARAMFQPSAFQRIKEITTRQAKKMVDLVHKLLVTSTPENKDQISFAQIDPTVRRNITKHVLQNDIAPTPNKSMFFASFDKEERERVVSEYVTAPVIR